MEISFNDEKYKFLKSLYSMVIGILFILLGVLSHRLGL